nr:hypothetical protein [Candidatus Sigynarchaeota archaeon]
MEAKIGEFTLPPSMTAEELADPKKRDITPPVDWVASQASPFVAGSVWYDSTTATGATLPTFINIKNLEDKHGVPVTTAWFDNEANDFADHLFQQYIAGQTIGRREWMFIRRRDPEIFRAIMQDVVGIPNDLLALFPTGVLKKGKPVLPFRLLMILLAAAQSGDPLYISQYTVSAENFAAQLATAWGDLANLPTLPALTQAALSCPSISEGHDPVTPLSVLTTQQGWQGMLGLLNKIYHDFDVGERLAGSIAEFVAGNAFWSELANGIAPAGWVPGSSNRQVEDLVGRMMEIMQLAFKRTGMQSARQVGRSFDMNHPAIQAFLTWLNTPGNVPSGTTFNPNGRGNAYTTVQNEFVQRWLGMWQDVFSDYGVPASCFDSKNRNARINILIQHFARAIIFDWSIGTNRGAGIDILARYYTRLPPHVQLVQLAYMSAFGVADRPVRVGQWCYTRVSCALPGGSNIDFVARYKVDANLDDPRGSGFQIFAVPSGSTYVPAQPITGGTSTTPVYDLWNIIKKASIPAGYASLSAYLDSLASSGTHGQLVQVGGQIPANPGLNGQPFWYISELVYTVP